MDIEFLYLGGRFEPNFYSLNEDIIFGGDTFIGKFAYKQKFLSL